MTKPSNKNPEIILNFKLTPTINMKNPIIPCFFNSEFNPLIANATEKASEIGNRIPKSQDYNGYSSFLLKSSSEIMMINIIVCGKPCSSNMNRFNRISQIDDDSDDQSNNLSSTFEIGATSSSKNAIEVSKEMLVSWIIPNLVYCCSRIWIGLSMKMGTDSNESGRFGGSASLVPMKLKVEDYVIPVRKSADAPPEDVPGHENANENDNGNGHDDNGAPAEPNGGNGGGEHQVIIVHEQGLPNGIGNNEEIVEGLRIQIFNANGQHVRDLLTQVVPANYANWIEFAGAVHVTWQLYTHQPPVVQLTPATCWPGSTTVFGRRHGQEFMNLNWPHHEWENVRNLINCLQVFAEPQPQQQRWAIPMVILVVTAILIGTLSTITPRK